MLRSICHRGIPAVSPEVEKESYSGKEGFKAGIEWGVDTQCQLCPTCRDQTRPQSILRCQISFGMVYSVAPNDQKPTKILQSDKFSDFGDPSSPPSHWWSVPNLACHPWSMHMCQISPVTVYSVVLNERKPRETMLFCWLKCMRWTFWLYGLKYYCTTLLC